MARKRDESRKMREPIPTVIGSGITEKWYFLHLKNLSHIKVEVKPRYFGSDVAYDMQKLVEGILSIGGKAICVFDMDTTRIDAVEKERKERFMAEYSQNPNVILCDSMPSIEYWFLLHFEKTNRYFESSEKVIEEIRHYMPFEKKEKFLSQPQWFITMTSNKQGEMALLRSKELGTEGESYTKIPKAILFLLTHK